MLDLREKIIYSFVSSDSFVIPDPPESYFVRPPPVICVYNNPTTNDRAIVTAMIKSCDRFYKVRKSKKNLRHNNMSYQENRRSFLWNSDWRKSVLSDVVSDDEKASIGESDCSYETSSEADVFASSSSLLPKREPYIPSRENYINFELAALSYTPVSTLLMFCHCML